MIALADDSACEDTPALRVTLERGPLAPSRARAALADFTHKGEFAAAELDTLKLLVSELVSNAVLHSDAPSSSGILLCARCLGHEALRVEVTDEGSGFIAAPRDPSRLTGGYGLFLVAQQSHRWGIDREGGTRVWFEIRRPAG